MIIQRQSLSAIRNDNLAAATDQLRLYGATVTAFDQRLVREIQICLDDGSVNPPYIFIGPENIAARVFGQEWRIEAVGRAGMPDPTHVDPLQVRYGEVSWTGEPALDYIKGKVADWLVYYQRLIVPVEVDEQPCFACFIAPERMAHVPFSVPIVPRIETLSSTSSHPPILAGHPSSPQVAGYVDTLISEQSQTQPLVG